MSKRPLIVIDGANIGHFNTIAGQANTKKFRSDRLLQAVTACQEFGLEPLVLLPQKFLTSNYKHNVAEDVESLLALEAQDPPLLSRLPSYINDDNPILRLALEESGYVLSNDGFNDHIRSGLITKEFNSTRVFKCYEFKGTLKLVPPEQAKGRVNRKKKYQPPPPLTPMTQQKRHHPPHHHQQQQPSPQHQQHPQHPQQQQQRHQSNYDEHQQLKDLKQRIFVLEQENAVLLQENHIQDALNKFSESQTTEGFDKAFTDLEVYQPHLTDLHFGRLKMIVKRIVVPASEERKQNWRPVTHRFRDLCKTRNEQKKAQELLIRQRIEEEQRLEAIKQREAFLLEKLQRDQAKAKQLLEQKRQAATLEKERALLRQRQQHFNLPPTPSPFQQQRQQQRRPPQQPVSLLRRLPLQQPVALLRRPPPAQSTSSEEHSLAQALQRSVLEGNRSASSSVSSSNEDDESALQRAMRQSRRHYEAQSRSSVTLPYEDQLANALRESAKDQAAQQAAHTDETEEFLLAQAMSQSMHEN